MGYPAGARENNRSDWEYGLAGLANAQDVYPPMGG
jgi:hypothetical protein